MIQDVGEKSKEEDFLFGSPLTKAKERTTLSCFWDPRQFCGRIKGPDLSF